MKIGIVTVYNSMNYGAFLQAYGMKRLLEERGHTVFFIEHHVRKPFIYTVAESGYKFVFGKRRMQEFLYVWKKYRNYKNDWRRFSLCKMRGRAFEALDIILFGSDEIWNVKRKQINKYGALFGKGFEHFTKIAYAPSLNDAALEDFERFPELINYLESFQHIAVRGENSKNVMEKLLNRQVEEVLDPTLLIKESEYQQLEMPYKNEKYILVYSYNNTISEDIWKRVVEFGREKGYKLVSVLAYLPWCDENPQLSVGELISCFRQADWVFTNTFHGVALSTALKKQFIVTVKDKQTKVVELLKKLKLEERILGNREIKEIIMSPIDYAILEQHLATERERCKEIMDKFLKYVIKEQED